MPVSPELSPTRFKKQKITKTYGKEDSNTERKKIKGSTFLKSYHQYSKSDAASDLFDAAFSSNSHEDVRISVSRTANGPQKTKASLSTNTVTTSTNFAPRKVHQNSTKRKKMIGTSDPYSFPEVSDSSEEDRSLASFGWGNKKTSTDISGYVGDLEAEESDSCDENEKEVGDCGGQNDGCSSQSSLSSQGSLSGNLSHVHLNTSPSDAKLNVKPRNSPKRPLEMLPHTAPKFTRSSSDPDRTKEKMEWNLPEKTTGSNPVVGLNKGSSIAVYKHKWENDDEDEEEYQLNIYHARMGKAEERYFKSSSDRCREKLKGKSDYDDGFVPETVFAKEDTKYYTKVRNVKEAHQCHEWGEAQEYKDDLDYLMDNLKNATPLNLKCLSMMGLAKKCLASPFRQFLRSQDCVCKIFHSVAEYCSDQPLALCTSCVLYLLARDRLSISVDLVTLKLVVKLMDYEEVNKICEEYNKYKSQVWSVLEKWKEQVQASAPHSDSVVFDLTKENLSTSFLATESLVYISARKTEDWFKSEIRKLGGLEIIVKKVVCAVNELPNPKQILLPQGVQTLKVLKRLLRILENVTFMNHQNQMFLISHKSCALLNSCGRLMQFFQDSLVTNSTVEMNKKSAAGLKEKSGRNKKDAKKQKERVADIRSEGVPLLTAENGMIVASSFSDLIRLLCNLSNDNELCCTKLGQLTDFLEYCISMITYKIPKYVPKQNQFDLMLLVLGLLINLVEYCNVNRRLIISLKATHPVETSTRTEKCPALEALTKMFLNHEAKARAIDEEVDKELDNAATEESSVCSQSGSSQNSVENQREPTNQEIEEIMEEVMTKAGKHMEDSIAASYFALLVGCIIQQNEDEAQKVKELLPGKNFKCMVEALNKFLEFMELANSHGNTKALSKVIEILEKLDSATCNA